MNRDEYRIIEEIQRVTNEYNQDNITRTIAYGAFYDKHPEVKWALLASMVSRNAGWNMCDLEGEWFPKILSKEFRERLFLTYERANWLIFSDAYPQLCMYEYSKKNGTNYFHLLSHFYVSNFMQNAWNKFWVLKEQRNLLYSLIINEQNIIQRPVIENPIYQDQVFKTWLFLLQDWLHFSIVLFPTMHGELYGASAHQFQNVTSRIELGKQLSKILFHPEVYPHVYEFSKNVEHTGSRYDYEQFLKMRINDTPQLRTVFPVINHHRHDKSGWVASENTIKKWLYHDRPVKNLLITDWYKLKQEQLHIGIKVERGLQKILHMNKLNPSKG